MEWYDWHTVTERLQGRAYALTRGRPYKVILDPNTRTGCCDFASKRILINPNLFSDVLQKMGLSGSKLDKANFLISRAVTGHEALHVLYSDPGTVVEAMAESPLLKTVLNILEDARIEKIGAATSHVSKTLFGFVNGIARNQLPEFIDDNFAIMHLLLRWRLGAHIPALNPNTQLLWSKVIQLATKALYAKNSTQVMNISREIIKIAGLDKPNPDESKDVQDILNKMQSNITGKRDSNAMPNPLDPGVEQNSGNDSTGSTEVTEGDNVEEQKGSGESGVTEEDFDDSDCYNPHAEDSRAKDSEFTSDSEPDNSSDHSVQSDAHDIADVEDIERLVEDTARHVSEDLDSLVPHVESSNQCSLVAEATPFRGRRYSNVIASPYANYLPEAAPIAAELIRDLKTDGPRAVSGASQTPGRFKARYYVRDRDKPFSAQKFQGMTTPKMALSLIIDRSGSMEDIGQEMRTMAMAITMACENLQIPLSIWALEGQVHVKCFDEHGPQVLAKIAGIQTNTLTRVMPTINDAVDDLKSRPEELKQIVLIHDGMPNDQSDFINWRTALKGIGIFCLFIMKQEDYQLYKDCPESLRLHMDHLVGQRNYAIAPVGDIAKHWCSFIKGIRNRHTHSVV